MSPTPDSLPRSAAAPDAARWAVRAISEGSVADPDLTLRQLLTDVIDDCRALEGRGSLQRPAVGARPA